MGKVDAPKFGAAFLGPGIYWDPENLRNIHRLVEFLINLPGKSDLGGGNSNIFYFHPENWGRFPF